MRHEASSERAESPAVAARAVDARERAPPFPGLDRLGSDVVPGTGGRAAPAAEPMATDAEPLRDCGSLGARHDGSASG